MRPFVLAILLGPLIRIRTPISSLSLNSFTLARKIPALENPFCPRLASLSRKEFSCFSCQLQAQLLSPTTVVTAMADLTTEGKEAVEKLAEPAGNEADILKAGQEKVVVDAKVEGESSKEAVKKEEEKLPKLSAAEFQIYNNMAEHMDYFHNHFRQSWNLLYQACVNGRRPTSLSLKQFINTGIQFCSHLAMHHGIEEQHIFPILAAKMPEFKQGRNAAELLRQHEEIHAGMDLFEEYLKKCRSGETELDLRVLKEKMDTWGTVLWTHLDQEVKTLGAENMRKYWTIEEMKRMPM